MIYRLFAVLVVAALIVGSVLMTGQQRETTSATTTEERAPDPGYAARNARIIQTGVDGQPEYTVVADTMRQLPDRDTIELEQVQLGFRDTGGNQWNARAHHGQVAQTSGMVDLSGDVHVTGALSDPNQQGAPEIISERLSVDTHESVAKTEDPVTLVWAGRQLYARGMLARLKDQQVQLESDVHGTYTP